MKAVFLTLVMTFGISTYASANSCVKVLSTPRKGTPSLADRLKKAEQNLEKSQATLLQEKQALFQLAPINTKLLEIISENAPKYYDVLFQVVGLDPQASNNQLIAKTGKELKEAGVIRENTPEGEVAVLLHEAKTGNPNFDISALRAQLVYSVEPVSYQGPQFQALATAMENSRQHQWLGSNYLKYKSLQSLPAAAQFKTKNQVQKAYDGLQYKYLAELGLPESLMRPYYKLAKQFADEGGPYATDKTTRDKVVAYVAKALGKGQITQELATNLRQEVWMHGQLPNELVNSLSFNRPDIKNRMEKEEAELRLMFEAMQSTYF
ncbi:MAG: hypothetical protein V4736_14570 [Bdellovibrionota bacterium]